MEAHNVWLKELTEFMGTSWPIALGVLLASNGLLLADHLGLEYVAALPTWALGAAFTGALLSGSALIVAIIRWILDAINRPIRKRRRIGRQAEHINALNDLPEEEGVILAWAIANGTQVVSVPYFNAHVKALMTKGYLILSPGSHHSNETPMLIPDHIWKVLAEESKGEDLSGLKRVKLFSRW
jgi:hypothetical protein